MVSTSESLLFRLSGGADPKAWDRFVALYTPLLLRWSGRLGLREADAADFTQDVLLILLRNFGTFRYDANRSFRAWLKTVLLNVWRKHQRRVARAPRGGGDVELAPDSDPSLFLDEAEHRDFLVRRALALAQGEFDAVTWRACAEYVMNGRPPAEVAQELGITVNMVYLAKSRVLRYLRGELAGLLDD